MTDPITIFLAKKALNYHNNFIKQYSIYYLSQTKNPKIITQTLLPLISSKSPLISHSAVYAITKIIKQLPEHKKEEIKPLLIEKYKETTLIGKISLLQILKEYNTDEDVKELLEKELKEADFDLLFAVIRALPTKLSLESLDELLTISSQTKDPLIVLEALEKWEQSVSQMPKEQRVEYCTPRIHALIRVYEVWKKGGDILFEILDHADKNKLPEGKLYPDVTMRIMLAFLEKYEYSPNAYKNVYRLIIPEYFALS